MTPEPIADTPRPVPGTVWRWLRWRGVLLALTLGAALLGLASGVGVSERPEVVDSGWLTRIYYTLGLFIFGGMDLGTPVGGPGWGRALLWSAYFSAPVITASALVEAVLRILQPQAWLLRRLDGHIVVAGASRLAAVYLRRLRASRPHVPVVVVELRADHPRSEELRDAFGARIIVGDITSEVLLRRLRLRRADRVVLLTDDDLTNLDAAAAISTLAPDLAARTIVHVGDLGFLRSVADTRVAQRCQIFNGHQIAATHLVDTTIVEHFIRTEPRDLVVLGGFGRFGQTILAELQARAPGKFDTVVIVDLEAERRVVAFDDQIGFGDDYRREVVDGDLRDPRVWRTVAGLVDLQTTEPVFVLGSAEDSANLRSAVWLAGKYPAASILVRTAARSSFTAEVGRDTGIEFFSVVEQVGHSMPAHWLGSARPEGGPDAATRPPGALDLGAAKRAGTSE